MYIPPFTISAEAINLIAEISGQIERYAIRLEQEDGLRLRKVNRIKTIHSSLAIEGNKLSEDQVRDIIDGKNVVAPIKEIQEVKNAIKTYEMYPFARCFQRKGSSESPWCDDAGTGGRCRPLSTWRCRRVWRERTGAFGTSSRSCAYADG